MLPIFSRDELNLRNDSDMEQVRTRKIFEALKEKAMKRETLSEYEKEFFCLHVKVSLLNDGNIEDYVCCDNYIFKFLYLAYFRDLTGRSAFYKYKGTTIYKVEPSEVQQDLNYLHGKSEEWDIIVQKTKHTDQLLQQLTIETRNEIKHLDHQPEFYNDRNAKGSFKYIFKRKSIILHSKYIYCIALEIFEALKPDDLILNINSTVIEFNEYSLVHILNRHFASTIKQYDTKKSFHNMDFKPRILSVQLKVILFEIDKSELLATKTIDKIGFQFNGTDYLLWTSEKTKSVRGKGNIFYRRIDSFYPVLDMEEKNKLVANYNLIKLSESLSAYVAK